MCGFASIEKLVLDSMSKFLLGCIPFNCFLWSYMSSIFSFNAWNIHQDEKVFRKYLKLERSLTRLKISSFKSE